jgi:hypothetical protein
LDNSITIATTIAPTNIDVQQKAVASWLKLGFHVISVNSAAEVDLLKDSFPGVTFVTAARDASAVAGKPFIYFDDILKALEAGGSRICGIVNSDICLEADDNFPAFIAGHACNDLVFGSRMDIENPGATEGDEYAVGFDFFFFDRSLIGLFPPSDFCLGIPWWDYWAPLIPVIMGVPVKQLITPVAYHLKHPANWQPQFFETYGRKILHYLKVSGGLPYVDRELVGRITLADSQDGMTSFAEYVCEYIKRKSEPVFYAQPGSVERMAIISRGQYTAMQKKLSDLAECNKQLRVNGDNLAAQLEAMKNSRSWRLTKPLRWLGDRLKR